MDVEAGLTKARLTGHKPRLIRSGDKKGCPSGGIHRRGLVPESDPKREKNRQLQISRIRQQFHASLPILDPRQMQQIVPRHPTMHQKVPIHLATFVPRGVQGRQRCFFS